MDTATRFDHWVTIESPVLFRDPPELVIEAPELVGDSLKPTGESPEPFREPGGLSFRAPDLFGRLRKSLGDSMKPSCES